MTIAHMLAVIALAFVLPSKHVAPRCDMAEINHVHNECGEVRFTQVIAWEWLPDRREYHAQDWCYVQSWNTNEKLLTYRNRDRVGQVRFRVYRETWTTNDPERDDSRVFSERYRVKVLQK